ncbi:MAG: glycoside hydrolase family 97 N-terminal domain-containing protein [Prevotellaceae bacterium]|nr:glycoside hydrolase family 97 N-terminal domain-containing protein [Candidatus Minthosoma equi]
MKKYLVIFLMWGMCCSAFAQYVVKSPDDSISVSLSVKRVKKYGYLNRVPNGMTMSVTLNGKRCIERKEVGLTVLSNGRRMRFGHCEMKTVANLPAQTNGGGDADLQGQGLTGRYNSLILSTEEGMMLQVRAYNDGVAYRFITKGFTGEYKILDVLKVFPDDVPIANLGTFKDDLVMPWRVLKTEMKTKTITEMEGTEELSGYKRTKFVPWYDALTSIMIGVNGHNYTGGAWRDVALDASPSISLTYKHLYTSVEFATCHQIMYINMGESYYPFCDSPTPLDFHEHPDNGVIGPVHAWNVGAHLGYRLPIQCGYNVWGVTPYVGSSLTHLTQHYENKHPFFGNLNHHDHFAVGPGIMLQINMYGRIAIGINYDYQFYTDSKAPNGRQSLGLHFGFQL